MIKTIENILNNGGIEEYQAEAKLLVLEVSGMTYEDILLGKKIENAEKIIELAKKRIETKAPIQHIIGYARFMGEKYIVNSNVLIPRDETEILVNKAYELIKKQENKLDILDIGVGSGCISCALAKKLKEKEIEILGVDISVDALEVAIENVAKLDLVRKVILRKSDIYLKIRECEKFDLIVSNPPYIPILQKENLQKEVKDFDPKLALFASDDDGVEFYERIIKDAPNCLKPNGFIAFELGVNQAQLVKKMLEKDFKNIEITKDLAGIERVITAQLI
ncbi:MAG: peptide chain release factor N(5)-glutamine methyltransferase [Candidatus Gastranaerophilales bacterium]|nr:peptide chain release factor N(5)-glutamine methyltransferase [Candidatus Gastranaerophilales bacterium]